MNLLRDFFFFLLFFLLPLDLSDRVSNAAVAPRGLAQLLVIVMANAA